MRGYYTRLALEAGFIEPLTVRGVVEQAIQTPSATRLRSAAIILYIAQDSLELSEEQEELLTDLCAIVAVEREWLRKQEARNSPSPLP